MSIVHFCGETWDLPEPLASRFREVQRVVELLSANRSGFGHAFFKAEARLITSMRCACRGLKWATAARIDADLTALEHLVQRDAFTARLGSQTSRKPAAKTPPKLWGADRILAQHMTARSAEIAKRLP